ncbi:hypothetical protein [Reichenbachiella sp. MALMAid0571]|uniref:hypothetical protein n=1 Tax=Reichenbachiella sp. MALMAid0571 TaxID=3143939 RepID=UPI0032DE5DA3
MTYKINYKKAFEQRCFQLIIEAYQTSLNEKVIQLDWNENDISSEIHKHIKENPLRIKWKVSSNVEAHIPKNISKIKGFADKFPRIDFRLTTFSKSNEYDYFFETKNLKQNDSALKRRYINTGINNFTSKKYENGSLIGYLVEGKINETVNGINALLKKDKRETENLNLKEDNLLKSYYESNHSEIGILKHLIFDFANISN